MNDMNLTFFILNILVVIMTGTLIAVMPFITRKSLLFGVRIPEAQIDHPEVVTLKRRFSLIISVFTAAVAAAVTLQYVFAPDWTLAAMIYAPFLIILLQFIAYIPSWRSALQLKSDKGWIVSTKGSADTRLALSRQTFSNLPWSWYIISILIAVAAGLVSLFLYPKLPDPMITHWNAAMEPDGWAKKSLLSVLGLPLTMIGMTVIMIISNMAVWRMKLQVSQEQPALSYAQHRVYRRLLSHMLGFISITISAMMTFFAGMTMGLWIPDPDVMWGVIMVPTILMIIVPIVFSIKVGQAGNKLNPEILPEDEKSAGLMPKIASVPQVDRQDDRFWKLGMFYYNKDDPTLFVEDRFGTNGGLNYARPAAWVFAAILAVLTIGTLVLVTVIFVEQIQV